MRSLALAVLLALGFAAPAYACSLSPCFVTVFPSSGSLPANMVRLRLTDGPKYVGEGSSMPRLFRLDGVDKVALPFELQQINIQQSWIVPTESLPVGTVLELEADLPSTCGSSYPAVTATYTITEAAALPTTLGALTPSYGRDQIHVASDAPCSEAVDAAYADLRIALTAEAEPYGGLFAYETYVDGEAHGRFSASLGDRGGPQGRDRVYAACGEDADEGRGISEGEHRIRFAGTLPDGTKLETPEITIDLNCGDGCSLAAHGSASSGLLVALALLLRRSRNA